MKIIVYSAKNYEKKYLTEANANQHKLTFVAQPLTIATADKATGYPVVCCFVTDILDKPVIEKLAKIGVKLIALRSAGYDHIDIEAARAFDVAVVNVPKYSPQAVAEFAVGLILILNRKILKAYLDGLEYNFSLDELMGFNLSQKTVGIIGTGNIGTVFARIMRGFGCRVLAYDPFPNEICLKLGINYLQLDQLFHESDIISLHCPLTKDNYHLLDEKEFLKMKRGVMLINTGRGALINTQALLNALESGQVGYAGLDVYEKERGLFFIDHHEKTINDQQFLKLQTMSNVIITPHQAFFTEEAIINITKTTIDNITEFEHGNLVNQVY